MADCGVLFVRSGEDEENDNPWDDTLLIRAYESAFEKAKKEVSNASSGIVPGEKSQPPQQTQSGSRKKWRKGDHCRTKFSEDGLMYEAFITKLMEKNCTVKFHGYNNEETVPLEDLKRSKGPRARRIQFEESRNTMAMECDESQSATECSSVASHLSSNRRPLRHTLPVESLEIPPPPLPPPPIFQQSGRAPDSNEALNAMLMSWYMSGYHTGYYEGVKRSEQTK